MTVYKNDHRQYTIITKVVIVDIKPVNVQQEVFQDTQSDIVEVLKKYKT